MCLELNGTSADLNGFLNNADGSQSSGARRTPECDSAESRLRLFEAAECATINHMDTDFRSINYPSCDLHCETRNTVG
jgi:hypothetical protein